MDKIKFSIFFLLFIFKISAFETPVFCKNLKNEDCNCDVKKVELLPSVDVPSVYDAFKELNFIHTNVKKLNDTNFILKKN